MYKTLGSRPKIIMLTCPPEGITSYHVTHEVRLVELHTCPVGRAAWLTSPVGENSVPTLYPFPLHILSFLVLLSHFVTLRLLKIFRFSQVCPCSLVSHSLSGAAVLPCRPCFSFVSVLCGTSPVQAATALFSDITSCIFQNYVDNVIQWVLFQEMASLIEHN